MVEGKSVALVGNALSLLDSNMAFGAQIENYDVVARINRGFPWQHPVHLGERTDIWANNQVMPMTVVDKLDPKWCMYSAPKSEDPPGDFFYDRKNNSDFDRRCRGWSMCPDLLHELSMGVGFKVSSGLRVLAVLHKFCKPVRITLFGFDFLKTPSWYWAESRTEHSPCHKGDREEAYVRGMEPRPEIWIMHSGAQEGCMEMLNRGQSL